jgi:hypothetical protein
VLTATGFFLFFVFFYHALLILIDKYIIVYNLRHGKYGFIVKVLSSNVPDDGYSRNVFSFLYTMYYIQARFYAYIFFIFALISLLIWLKQYFLKLLSVLILGMSLIHLGSRLHIVTRRVSYKKQELLTLCEQLSSPLVFGGVHVAYIFRFLCCPIICLYVLSSYWDVRYGLRIKTMVGSSLPHLFVGGIMSYFPNLCLLHIVVLSMDYMSNMAGIL